MNNNALPYVLRRIRRSAVGNAAVGNAAVGIEYKKGAEFSTFKNADYWNAHLAWFVDSHLTLVAAYVNAVDKNSQTKVGLGGGTVLSVQYVF